MAATRFVRTTVRRATILVVLFSLTSCAFEPSITPIAWPTVGQQPLSGTPLVPQPSPIPIAPTPSPQPPEPEPFHGWEDLDCGALRGGDDRFGYCGIPGTDTYYVWGPCQGPCPEGSYPGVELWVVSDSTDLRDYMMLVDQRDDAREDRNQGLLAGGFVGGLDILGAVIGFAPACIVGTTFTLGTSCIGYFALVGAATTGAGIEIARGIHGMGEFNRLTDALPGYFFGIPHEAP
ncbi:MAG TPA: hypothetical protein VJJ46_05020 [Anaerolineales bacterium]|nr:hypothetical protein [Anaerolineales bacterium]